MVIVGKKAPVGARRVRNDNYNACFHQGTMVFSYTNSNNAGNYLYIWSSFRCYQLIGNDPVSITHMYRVVPSSYKLMNKPFSYTSTISLVVILVFKHC